MIKKFLIIFILFMSFSTTTIWAEEIQEPPIQCVIYEDGTEQCFKEIPNVISEPIKCENYPEEIYQTTGNIDELKRELGANMEDKKSVLNKDNVLYGIIGLLSILTLIFGIKAFKKK